ncbi:MAG: FUN14 domain-containing protein [Asgard group archaeon]|nr:FUN14 domain-containing protein [Asgard group archaeon]
MFVNSLFLPGILKRSFGSVRSISSRATPKYQFLKFNNTFQPIARVQRASYNSSSSNTFKLLFASAGSSFLILSAFSKKIHNDTATQIQSRLPSVNVEQVKSEIQQPFKKSRFNGYLNYEELTIGSVVGLFLGIIIGKLSQVIVFVSLSSYFLLEFLENRNIITIPWNYFITIGKERINLKQLFFEKPSFKISFVLSFIIAAYNV